MQVDKTTLTDLSIFHADEDQSVFSHLNFTHTNGGREYLKGLLNTPLTSINKIQTTQQTIQILQNLQKEWPITLINNGALLVIEKFYETAIDQYPQHPAPINSWIYSILHAPDYSITKYTVTHAIAFVKGMQQILDLFEQAPMNDQITIWANDIGNLLNKPIIQEMLAVENNRPLSPLQVLKIGGFLRNHFKRAAVALSDIFCRIDAYMSMAIAGDKYALVFPELQQREQPFVHANGLFHLLLPTPVAYDTTLVYCGMSLFFNEAPIREWEFVYGKVRSGYRIGEGDRYEEQFLSFGMENENSSYSFNITRLKYKNSLIFMFGHM